MIVEGEGAHVQKIVPDHLGHHFSPGGDFSSLQDHISLADSGRDENDPPFAVVCRISCFNRLQHLGRLAPPPQEIKPEYVDQDTDC